MRTYTFSIYRNNKRIDQLIPMLFPKLSRNYVQHLIEESNVLLNEKCISSHKIPQKKDIILLKIPSLKESGIVPSDIPLDILYQDNDVIVINKQPGIVVHPSDNGGHMADSIVNALLFHCKDFQGINGTLRPGIVHRLDKDTSGILVVAKNDEAMAYLATQWQKRTVQKEYTTLVYGHLTPKKGSIEAPIGRSAQDRKKMSVRVGAKTRYALTHYEVIEYIGDYTLLKVQIVTGRTHQIRVHFQSIGHPVVGDETYGKENINHLFEKECGLKRQFLHASDIEFKLPSNKKTKKIYAPLPKDLEKTLRQLQ